MIYAAPAPGELGLPERDIDDAIALVAGVPFLPAIRRLSLLAARVYHAHLNLDSHRRLAAAFYSGSTLQKVVRFLGDGPQRVAFDPRQIAALQRLVIVHGADSGPRELDGRLQERLADALLALAGALPLGEQPDALADDPEAVEAWVRYIARTGLYYARPWVVPLLARAWSWYVTVAADLRTRKKACSADDWLRDELNLSLAEQVAVGLAFGISAGVFEPTLSDAQRDGCRPRRGFLVSTALAASEAAAFNLLSASREEFRVMFAGDDPDWMQLAWEHSAFERRPFLREPDGTLLLTSPWGLMSWMTRGIHYRALDAGQRRRGANGRPRSGRWLRHSGALGEEHVRRLLAASLPDSPYAGVRLHGEIRFKGLGGRQDSPDAAIDCWPDLVLVEVFSGRFAREARVSADPELLLDALEDATVKKIAQVLLRADDVLAGRLVYPDSVGAPSRIWPVVVLAGDSVTLTPFHWRWIRERLASREAPPYRLDTDPRVRRPIIVDLDDLEPLLVLVEQGAPIVKLLDSFLTSDGSEGDLRGWLGERFDLDTNHHPRYVIEQWALAMQAGGEALYPGSERVKQAIEDAKRI